MSKTSLTFKIVSITLFTIDILFAVFFMISLILTLAKVSVFGNLHFILLIITVALNIIYFVYTLITLKIHKK